MSDWREVGSALVATYGDVVSRRGRPWMVGYCDEIAKRGVTPDQALDAIRSYRPTPGTPDFPPSANMIASIVERHAASTAPTSDEITAALWGAGGVMHARARGSVFVGGRDMADRTARLEAAWKRSDLLGRFVSTVGPDTLAAHDPRDLDAGGMNRGWLVKRWSEFCDVSRERQTARIVASARRGELQSAQAAIEQVAGGAR